MDPASSIALSLPTEYNKIGVIQIGSLEKSKQPITIHPKDGSIHILGLDRTGVLFDINEHDKKVGNILLVAAKILSKSQLTKPEKQFKKTAKLVVEYYKKELKKDSNLTKSNLSENFNKVGNSILNQVQDQIDAVLNQNRMESREALNKEVNDKIITFAQKMLPEIKNDLGQIQSNFNLIHEYGSIHACDGADVFRHLMAGIVSIKADGEDIFANSGINKKTVNLSPVESLQKFKNSIGLTLHAFEERVCVNATKEQINALKGCIINFIENIGEQPDETSASVELDKACKLWAQSENPAEMNLSRLMHAMNQLYNISRLKAALILISDYGKDSPYHLLGLTKSQIKYGIDSKAIEYQFRDNAVDVIHKCTLKSPETSVKILQTITLTSDTDNLGNWNGKFILTILTKENETALANAIQRIYLLAGLDCEINVVA